MNLNGALSELRALPILRKPALRRNGYRICGLGPDGKGIMVKFPRCQRVSVKEFQKENADPDYVLSFTVKMPWNFDLVKTFFDDVEEKIVEEMSESAADWLTVSNKGGRGKKTGPSEINPEQANSLLKSGQSTSYFVTEYGNMLVRASIHAGTEFYDEDGHEISFRIFKEKIELASSEEGGNTVFSCIPVLNLSHVWCDGHVRNGLKVKLQAVRLFKPTMDEIEAMTAGNLVNGPDAKRRKVGAENLLD